MAFKKEGMSVPLAFTKRTTNNEFKQYPRDILAVLKEVHPAADGQGSITVSEKRNDGTERIYNVRIKSSTIERLKNNKNANSTTRKWSGGLIDESFAKEFKAEDVLVLEQTIFTGPKKTVNGVETYFIETNWIHSGDPDESKNFRAVFSISVYDGRVSAIRHLQERNISVEDADGLQEIREKLDEIEEATNNGEFVPGLTISFHTLVPHVLKSGKDGYKEIDRSPPFSWVSAEKDSDGVVLTKGHHMTSEDFDSLLAGYVDYIYGPDETEGQGFFDNDTLKNVKVEIKIGTNYRASTMSNSLVINPQYTGAPLYRLANTETKYALDDTGYVKSQNIAVDGIVMLSADKMEKVGREAKIIRRDLVTRLFVNGFMKDASEMTLASDGLSVEVDEKLKAPSNYSTADSKVERSEEKTTNNQAPVDKEHDFDLPTDAFGDDSDPFESENKEFDDSFFGEEDSEEDFFDHKEEKTTKPVRSSRRDV